MAFRKRGAGEVGLLDFPRLVAVRKDAAKRARLFSKPDLTYLFWECTLRCNLRCAHCGSSCEAKSPLRELETPEILAIVDSIAEDFRARRIFVSITGGEPLLRPDLYEVVARMTHHGMRSCIVTNGTLLGAQQATRLFDAGMRTVSVSIDGLEAEHDAVRGKGSWQRAMAGIAEARCGGMHTVEAITCVRPDNLGSLSQIEKAVREAGANLYRVITIDKMGRLADGAPAAMWLEPPQINRLLDWVEGRRKEIARKKDRFDVRFSCGGFLGVRRELAVRPGNGQCFAGLCVGSILADGQVSACPSLPRTWAQGSAREERFSKIWYGRFEKFRGTAWRKEGPCADCSLFEICLGGGLHERLAQPDSFCWIDRQRE